jgi:hypothetical protein
MNLRIMAGAGFERALPLLSNRGHHPRSLPLSTDRYYLNSYITGRRVYLWSFLESRP